MNRDIQGDAYIGGRRAVRDIIGPYGGFKPPRAMSGQYVWPLGFWDDNSGGGGAPTVTLTANLAYYVPFPVFERTTFAQANCVMNTTGGPFNGRMCLAAQATTGGPGALLKDFGAQVLATSGLYGFAAVITVDPQMCYLGLVSDGTPVMRTMAQMVPYTNVGMITPAFLGTQIPTFTAPGAGVAGFRTPLGYTAAFTYGAWADPVAVPTATLTQGAASTIMPLMTLKV